MTSRWFGGKKKRSSSNEDAKSSQSRDIERDVVVTIKTTDSNKKETKKYIVMAIFDMVYCKWNMSADNPTWEPMKEKSKYRLALRQVEFREMYMKYCYVEVSDEDPVEEVFKLVALHEVTSIVTKISKWKCV